MGLRPLPALEVKTLQVGQVGSLSLGGRLLSRLRRTNKRTVVAVPFRFSTVQPSKGYYVWKQPHFPGRYCAYMWCWIFLAALVASAIVANEEDWALDAKNELLLPAR